MSQLTDQQLKDYIEGRLAGPAREKVESVLRRSNSDFRRYLSFKETMYLGEIGRKPDLREKERIMGMLPLKKPHLQILLSFVEDRIIMSSADNESLGYEGLQADFAFRSNEPGPISIGRTIEGRNLKFVITPEAPETVRLSVLLDPPEKLSVSLILDEEELESISDLSGSSDFSSSIPRNGEVQLLFRKKGEELFSVGFTLRSD